MPLTAAKPRAAIHTRTIECTGYHREDGLWDIEGHLNDSKSIPHGSHDGSRYRQPGEPIHRMSLRVTIDLDFLIHDVEAVTDEAPYAPCLSVGPAFRKLIGTRIGKGWRAEARKLTGGALGCTHLNELLGRIATVAYQSTNRARADRPGGDPDGRAKRLLNTCQAYEAHSPIVKTLWPKHYKGD